MLELGWDDMREQIGFHSTSCIETTHETLGNRQEAYPKHPRTDAVINQCSDLLCKQYTSFCLRVTRLTIRVPLLPMPL